MNKGKIWHWSFYPSEFKVFVHPQFQSVSHDLIIPAKYYNRTAKLLGLPPRKKHPSRVKSGMAAQRNLRSFENHQKYVGRVAENQPQQGFSLNA